MKKLFTLLISLFLLGAVSYSQYEATFDGDAVPGEYNLLDENLSSNLRIEDGKLAYDVTSLGAGYSGIIINLNLPFSELPDADTTITFTVTTSEAVQCHVRGWAMVDDTIPVTWEGGLDGNGKEIGMVGWWSQSLGADPLTPTFSIKAMLRDPDVANGSVLTSVILDFGEGPDTPVTFYIDDVNINTGFINIEPYEVKIDNQTVLNESEAGTVVGMLSTDDEEEWQVHLYSLVAGDGDADNASFMISADTLKTNFTADFAAKASYSIRVKSDDHFGGTIEEQFEISIDESNKAAFLSDHLNVKAYFISPNQIQINSTGSLINKVSVCDMSGRVVCNQRAQSNNMVINLGQVPSGLYFVTVQKNNSIVTRKLMKY